MPIIEESKEIDFIQSKIGERTIYEMIPEELTKGEQEILNKAEKESKKEVVTKAVMTDKVVKVGRTVTPLTEEQNDFINSSIDLYKKGELTKKELVIKFIEFGITKQQVDKFVDSTVVGWAYAYY